MSPKVSIVIVNYNHPEVINICLRSLPITEGIDYEVVVVDNGSEPESVEALRQHKNEGRITTLVEEKVNHYFSEGNNIGVRNSNPESEYVLLLNSDIGITRPDWLTKIVSWIEGTSKHWPSIWNLHPAQPKPGPLDVVSVGWSHDANVLPGRTRPEGFCCLFRRTAWQDMSTDFPWHGGFEEMVSKIARAGHRVGVLSQYGSYFVHREGASGKIPEGKFLNRRTPDIPGWFNGLNIETLDFELGPNEHDSYLWW